MDKKLETRIRKLSNLPENAGLSEAQLLEKAQSKKVVEVDKLSLLGTSVANKFRASDERRIARQLEDKYLDQFAIENIADKNSLDELIYLEVIQIRLQEKINDFHDKDLKAMPLDLIELMHRNADMIIKLKATLGLNKGKKGAEPYDALQHLMKRHQQWLLENQASRHLKCPHCFQMIWLKIKMEAWDAQKHPFFRDTFLYNRALFDNLGKVVTITRDFLASVFETSPDYIDHTVERLKKETYRGEESQEITAEESGSTEIQETQIITKDALVNEILVVGK